MFDPDDVCLKDSPLLQPKNPNLQPTPSPSPEIYDSPSPPAPDSRSHTRCTNTVPSQGDEVMINFLGGGKALGVARIAAAELLVSDDEMSGTHSPKQTEMNVTMTKKLEKYAPGDIAAVTMGAVHFSQVVLPGEPSAIGAPSPLAVIESNGLICSGPPTY